ncbi:two-component system sensor histidine kinase CssS [Paenibacillus mucilaginosus]|uniref:HAMP domain-containing sensor histidine kinase n=1 Tax=Paenibacillus mucilaginosus TaxID=61624 RepID=UPI003D207333
MSVKHWPLSVKLWGVFAALTLFIFGLLALLLPWMLKGFFTDQLYDLLVDSQTNVQLLQRPPTGTEGAGRQLTAPQVAPKASETVPHPGSKAIPSQNGSPAAEAYPGPAPDASREMRIRILPDTGGVQDVVIEPGQAILRVQRELKDELEPGMPRIQHFMIRGDSAELPARIPIAAPFVEAIEKDAQTQERPLEKYTRNINDQTLFYVIRKEQAGGSASYLVSYTTGSYRNDLVMAMFVRLMLLMVGLIVFSWLPCLVLARYLTRPLVQMERHVGRLAERDWHEPLETARRDEIGRLAQAIESMRQRLVRQDQAQQFFLQNISHELKTPVMVIRSYVQSIQDGIFPRGSLQGSLSVILKESERLERKVLDLLLLNKLNYMSSREKETQAFPLAPVVDDTVQRLRFKRPDIRWEVSVPESAAIRGDPEQWGVALENLLDNQLRYAESVVRLSVDPGDPKEGGRSGGADGTPVIRIANDGPRLDEETLSRMFEPFQTGEHGQFGLGLTIVRQIAANHGMTVRAVNESDSVAFYLEPIVHEKAG